MEIVPIINYILFLLGFYLLVKGADLFIDGSVSIARKLNVSDLVIGLTLVSFGTSAPELAVNVISSIKGNSDIAISNILGSNIANLLLILGISAVIRELNIQENTTYKEIPFSLLAAIVVFILANDQLINFNHQAKNLIERNDGMILLCFFIIFLYYVFSISKDNLILEPELSEKEIKLPIAILYIFLGLVGLIVGGDWVVDGAIQIARLIGISESFIGLSIVAVGTSLPELVTSVIAAYKKNSDIAVGNVVGSNIFNIFFILGISALINPLNFKKENILDLNVTIFSTLIVFILLFIGKKHTIQRNQGILLILFYLLYIIFRSFFKI
jgi:cation:H+ antiporter